MTNKIWTPQEVENYLQNEKQKGNRLILPEDAYCTQDFTWNEVLRVNDPFFEMPPLYILENLKSVTDVLQIYRDEFGKPINITSSWRTPAEQQELIRQFNAKKLKNQPSPTSLHLEGLAFDVVVSRDL